ncbi:ribonuclease toxin immunity protein CdiI [Paenibacillus sp. EC2-1]|uniref:ribonuclease toxin immunity protein CdiI n=1 Tax=Paenibacillus sp. EC2-1 TaxID=3388665 RepID=UPI003BEEF230
MKIVFNFNTNEYSYTYCLSIVEDMQRYLGISKQEAVDRINSFWKDVDLTGDEDLIFHENPTYWAYQIFSDDSAWWNMKKEDITPRKYTKSKVCIYPDEPLEFVTLSDFKILKEDEKNLLKLYYSHIPDEKFIGVLRNYQKLRGNQEDNMWCVFANEFDPWDDFYFGETGVMYFIKSPLDDQEFAVDNEHFFNYLEYASLEYLKRNPKAEQVVKGYLNQIKNKLGLNSKDVKS